MRCSSCEIVLDRYVEGTLPAREMAAVSRHLQTCDACTHLLGELRVVDALLATTKSVDLAPNFTFAVMAEARALRIIERRSLSLWAVLSFYVIAAWLGLSGIALVSGGRLPWLGAGLSSIRNGIGDAFAAVAGAAQGFGSVTPLVVGTVAAILVLDVVLAATIFIAYRTIRPRLAAQLARSESL